MLENLTFYLILVIITVLLVMLAKKIKVAYPVLLVLAGLGISFIPGTPKIHIEPELIFLYSCRHFCMKLPGRLRGKNCGVGAGLWSVLLSWWWLLPLWL